MELYNKYVNNEISLVEYILKSKKYVTYELTSDRCNKLVKKFKTDIKNVGKDVGMNVGKNTQISLELDPYSKDKTYILRLISDFKDIHTLHITLKEVLEKEKSHILGSTYYLLGMDENKVKYYLEKGKFDCGWYWSGGYIETFNRNKSDINLHTHYDTGEVNGLRFSYYDDFDKIFKVCTLTDSEKWKFHELMRTFYTATEAMKMSYRGGNHITTNPLSDLIQNKAVYNHYNNLIKKIHEELDKLLS